MPKVVKAGGELAITLPKEIIQKLGLAEGMTVKFFEVTSGTFAFERAPEEVKLTEDDLDILGKLLAFKFEDRVPTNVNKKLSMADKKKLTVMVRKGVINLYKGGRYAKTGVYQVPNTIYNQFINRSTASSISTGSSTPVQNVNVLPKSEAYIDLPPLERLEKLGYLVSTSESEATELSNQLEKRMKKKEVRGVRGFDKNYYIVKNSFVTKHFSKLREVLGDKTMTAGQIAQELNIDLFGCIALLTVLNEEGEVIEKRKGIFMLG